MWVLLSLYSPLYPSWDIEFSRNWAVFFVFRCSLVSTLSMQQLKWYKQPFVRVIAPKCHNTTRTMCSVPSIHLSFESAYFMVFRDWMILWFSEHKEYALSLKLDTDLVCQMAWFADCGFLLCFVTLVHSAFLVYQPGKIWGLWLMNRGY